MPRPLITCCALLAWIAACLLSALPRAAWLSAELEGQAVETAEASVHDDGAAVFHDPGLEGSGDDPSWIEDLLEEQVGLHGAEPRAAGAFVDRAQLDAGGLPPARVWLESASPPPRASHA